MERRLLWLFLATALTFVFLGGCGPITLNPNQTICTATQDCPGRLRCQQGRCVALSTETTPTEPLPSEISAESTVESLPSEPPSEPTVESLTEPSLESVPEDAGSEPSPERPPDAVCEDEDKDGYCANLPNDKGQYDCNDKNKQIHPNAPEQCNGEDDNCNGQIDEDLTPPPCSKTQGVCSGAKKTCKGKQGWADCTDSDYLVHSGDYESKETTCDGKDNDCNGLIDDNVFLPTAPCQTPQKLGECARGQYTGCKDGKLVCTSNIQPQPIEICDNGKDDDCNGSVDENPPCACINGKKESCYDGLIGCTRKSDGSYTCISPCQAGSRACLNSRWGACLTQITPSSEICNGKDDDCDGTIDNNTTDSNKDCNTSKPGICQDGRTQCANGTLSCTSIFQATPETCNGKDDDCNGNIDDNPQEQGKACPAQATGECKNGSYRCEAARLTCVPASPTPEICNGKDDDCDGSIDNTEGTSLPIARSCYGGPAQSLGVGLCIDGTQRCINGTWDACNNAQTPRSSETCDNAADDNCDHSLTYGCNTCNPSRVNFPLTPYGEHSDAIRATALSPNNLLFVSASKTGEIRIWSRTDGLLLSSLRAHTNAIQDLAISNDNTLLASASSDKSAAIWTLSTAQRLRTLSGHSGEVVGIRFIDNDQALITVSDDGYLHRYNTADGTLQKRLKIGFNARSLAISPQTNLLAVGGSLGDIALFDLSQHKFTKQWKAHSAAVLSLAFSPDGKELASGSSDRTILIWNTDNNLGQKLYTLSGLQAEVYSVFYDPQKRFFFAGTAEKLVRAWRLPLYTYAHAYTSPNGAVTSIQAETTGTTLYAATDTPRTYSWPIASPTASARPFPAHNSHITALAQNNNIGLLASGDDRGTIVLWKQGTLLRSSALLSKHNATISRLAFTADGKTLVSTSRNGDIVVWETSNATLKTTFSSAHLGKAVSALSIQPNSPSLFVSGGDDGRIIAWDISKNKDISTLALPNSDLPLDLQFQDDNKTIAVGASSGRLYILSFDGINLKLERTLTEHQNSVLAVAFGSRPTMGAPVLASSDVAGRIVFWTTTLWNKVGDFTKANARYSRLQFGSTPQYLFAQSDAFLTVDILDVSNRKITQSLRVPQSLHSFLWHPESFTLFAGSDAILHRWTCP
ncbi:hypothetical protein L6R29_16390 [Myxococcota bacterium]|nr:hypothetical protein [Myxococcota bacterium]